MIAITLSLIIFLGLVRNLTDPNLYTLIILSTFLCIYSCYFYEKKMKLQFLHMHQIKQMNLEMKEIFNNIQEGIVLYNPKEKKVSLINQQFRKLFENPSNFADN